MLPDNVTYKELKERITTRRELNRVINSLKRFQKQTSDDIYTTDAGVRITKWEKQELQKEKRTAIRRINQRIEELNMPLEGSRYSRAQMGSGELRSLEAQLKNLNKLEEVRASEFKRLRERIHNIGTSDVNMRRAVVFRENFMKQLEELSKGYPGFQTIYQMFDKITNPLTFYEVTQKSRALEDFFEWYEKPNSYGGFRDEDELVEYIQEEYRL